MCMCAHTLYGVIPRGTPVPACVFEDRIKPTIECFVRLQIEKAPYLIL